MAPGPVPAERRLDSWKAIASYLNRDVRTVQRWEARESLPVHRHQHDRLASVYAFSSELDRWLKARSLPPAGSASVSATPEGPGRVDFTGLIESRSAVVLTASIPQFGQLRDEWSPQTIDRAIDALNGVLAACAEAFGGEVIRRFGPIGAIGFGIRQFHEDEAVRAARAAHALRSSTIEYQVSLTIGIDFGPVLFGIDQSLSHLTGSGIDNAVRLSDRAERGEVLVGAAAWRMLVHRFNGTPADPQRAGHVNAHILGEEQVGLRQDDAVVPRGLSAFVGRERELTTLVAAVRDAASGRGALLHVTGDAGLGKSRLLLELRRQTRALPVQFLIGRCVPHARASYHPLIEAMTQGLGIDDGSGRAVADRVRSLDTALGPFVPHIERLLSGTPVETLALPAHLDGLELKAALSRSLSALLLAMAAQETTVLLLEDWHWADEGSVDVLHYLHHSTSGSRVLIVVTSRPELLAQQAVPVGVPTLALEALSFKETAQLAERLVAGPAIRGEFVTRLHVKSGGNPFFVEEICDLVAEHASADASPDLVEIPSTVQAVIRSRLDRLADADRAILRAAAVIGREFRRGTLAHLLSDASLLDDGLQRLTAARILQAIRLGTEATFRFKHVLTQEVAYLSMPAFERRAAHAKIASLLHAESRVTTADETFAFHFSRAGDWDRAAEHGFRAAHHAASLSQFPRAVELLEQARGWLSKSASATAPAFLIDGLLLEEHVREILGERDQQERLIGELLDLLERQPDPDRLAQTLIRLGELRTLQGKLPEAEELLLRALNIVGDGYPRTARRAWRALGFCQWRADRYEDGCASSARTLAIDRSIGDVDGLVYDLTRLAAIHRGAGDHRAALASVEEAKAAATDPNAGSFVFQVWSSIYRTIGDTARAIGMLEEAIATQTKANLPIHRAFSMLALGGLLLEQNEVERALQLCAESVGLYREVRYRHGLASALPRLAEALARNGNLQESAACLEESLELRERLQERDELIDVIERLAWTNTALGRYGRVRRAFDDLVDCAARTGAYALAAATGERIADALSDPSVPIDDRRVALERTIGLATAAQDDHRLARVLTALANLEYASGRGDVARGLYEHALTISRRIGDPTAEGLLLNALGAALRAMGRPYEAQARLEEAIVLHARTGTTRLAGHALALLGDVSYDMGDMVAARHFYDRSRELRQAAQDNVGEAWMLQRLAILAVDVGAVVEATSLLATAQSLAASDAPPKLQAALTELSLKLQS